MEKHVTKSIGIKYCSISQTTHKKPHISTFMWLKEPPGSIQSVRNLSKLKRTLLFVHVLGNKHLFL